MPWRGAQPGAPEAICRLHEPALPADYPPSPRGPLSDADQVPARPSLAQVGGWRNRACRWSGRRPPRSPPHESAGRCTSRPWPSSRWALRAGLRGLHRAAASPDEDPGMSSRGNRRALLMRLGNDGAGGPGSPCERAEVPGGAGTPSRVCRVGREATSWRCRSAGCTAGNHWEDGTINAASGVDHHQSRACASRRSSSKSRTGKFAGPSWGCSMTERIAATKPRLLDFCQNWLLDWLYRF